MDRTTRRPDDGTIRVWIPALFASDHNDRDLPCGNLIAKHPRKGWCFDCTKEELEEWLSDSEYYSDCAGRGWDIGYGALALQSSARATATRVRAILKPGSSGCAGSGLGVKQINAHGVK